MAKEFTTMEREDLTDCHAYLSQFEGMIIATHNMTMTRFLPDIAKKRLFIAEMLGWSENTKALIRSNIEDYEKRAAKCLDMF